MSAGRRTAEEAKTWLEAAQALLRDVGVETMLCAAADKEAVVLAAAGMGLRTPRLRCYWTGTCSIAGVLEAADWLCEPLARHGLLEGWSPGSRGAGVTWAPRPVTAALGQVAPAGLWAEFLARTCPSLARRPEGWAVGDRESISAARRLGLDPNDLTRADLGRVLAEARP